MAIRGKERGTTGGTVGLDAAAVEAFELVADDLLDVGDGAAGEELLVANDAGGEVVEGARDQKPEDDERREQAEGNEKERARLQGIADPGARAISRGHGAGGVSGAGGAGSSCAGSP